MTSSTLPIVILGAGHIGKAAALLLQQRGGYAVCVADQDAQRLAPLAQRGCETVLLDARSDDAMAALLTGRYAVLNALPFHRTVHVAQLAVQAGVHYFDLTEDVRSTQLIESLGAAARSVLMPQCGLAPGFIGIVGHDLANRFDDLLDLHMRVGALPRFPFNTLRYNLTWSTEGLINQYSNPCDAIVDGQAAKVQALEGYETFSLDGIEYEAFNTSGGLGTLTKTLLGRARHVDYKSVRYPGHWTIMRLLLHDLRLRERPDLLKEILENAVPSTQQDVIVIFATAAGHQQGRLVQASYSARIIGTTIDGQVLSAIELTTAASLCAALDLVRDGRLPQAGFIGQEQVVLADFLANRFGRIYAEGSLEHAQA